MCNVEVVGKVFMLNLEDSPDGIHTSGNPRDWARQKRNMEKLKKAEKGIPVIITKDTLRHPAVPADKYVGALGSEGHGIIVNSKSLKDPVILPHEMGHVAGYDEGDVEGDKSHSSDKKNLMYPTTQEKNPERDPDKCWCEKVSKLTRERK